jgi:hypothetical protein
MGVYLVRGRSKERLTRFDWASVLTAAGIIVTKGTKSTEKFRAFCGYWQLPNKRRPTTSISTAVIKIKIYDDNTAMVESELYETFTTRQGSLRSSASEVLFVSLKDGKVMSTPLT